MAEGRDHPTVVTWWGHATVGIRDSGTTVLTDPVLTNRLGHLRRRRGADPGLVGDDLPDVVLLSHLHADHTHLPSLDSLGGDAPIVLPRGAPDKLAGLRRFGSRLLTVDPGDVVHIGPLRVTAVPAAHDGRRWRRGPNDVAALGFVVEGAIVTYFAGDTALFDDMSTWVPRCDVALLPVGGWGPTLGAGHMEPGDAALAASRTDARLSIPIHYGTLWPIGFDRIRPSMFYEPGTKFRAAAALLERGVRVLDPGESVHVTT
nr:MBL fold metallo-hydrolase [Rhodococcus yunnanensis]